MNEILVTGLRVPTCIGVPAEERANHQEIEIDLRIGLGVEFAKMGDDISRTIDYAEVCAKVAELSALRPRALIETLAWEVGTMVLEDFGAAWVEVEIKKYILPRTRSVGVRCRVVGGST